MDKQIRISLLMVFILLAIYTLFSGMFVDKNVGGQAVYLSKETVTSASIQSKNLELLSNQQKESFSIKQNSLVQKEEINKNYFYQPKDDLLQITKQDLTTNFPKTQISSISITGTANIYSTTGFVRVILTDKSNKEWLIFGTDFLFIEDTTTFENICEETCQFEKPIYIKDIKIELKYANLNVQNINFQHPEDFTKEKTLTNLRREQNTIKRNLLSNKIQEKQFTWISGETEVSKKLYRDLKKLQYETSTLRIPYEFFFYKGGLYQQK